MTYPELLKRLASSDVRLGLFLDADLPADAPDDLEAALREHKPLLVARLAREALWEHLSRQRWGPGLSDDTAGIDNPGRRPTLETLAAALRQGVER
jgi:hypothetical protein